MWTRGELKNQAKNAMGKNYWKLVLAGLIVSLMTGAFGSGFSQKFGENDNTTSGWNFVKSGEVQSGIHQVKSALKSIGASYLFVIVVAIIILVLIIMCVSLLFKVFLVNPVIVGAKRFFSRSVVEKAELKELLFSFDHGYLNSVKAMFFKSLFTFLWTCLLLIPGAVKHYEYYMVPYLVGENPDMDWQEAFRRSKEMMRGQKWNAFVLDLSFAGWIILSGMTIGLVGIFYLTPYREVTKAGLFRKLSGVDEIVDEAYLN